MKPGGEVISEDDVEQETQQDPSGALEQSKNSSDEDYKCLAIPQCLVVRRALNVQVKLDDTSREQRANLFHTRGLAKGMPFSIIIDSGSCSDVVSTLLVHSLGLPTKRHPTPYHLNWFNDGSFVKVQNQVDLTFQIGDYEDTITCDVTPMQACHLLLGRPWQFDRKALHDGFKNSYKFSMNDRKFLLLPLPPSQVYDDQLKLEKASAAFNITISLHQQNSMSGVIPLSVGDGTPLRDASFGERVSDVSSVNATPSTSTSANTNFSLGKDCSTHPKKISLLTKGRDLRHTLITKPPLILVHFRPWKPLALVANVNNSLPSVLIDIL